MGIVYGLDVRGELVRLWPPSQVEDVRREDLSDVAQAVLDTAPMEHVISLALLGDLSGYSPEHVRRGWHELVMLQLATTVPYGRRRQYRLVRRALSLRETA